MPGPHDIEITEPDRHVRITRDGVVLADTKRPVVLTEGKLPARYYIDPDDVRTELLERSDSKTHCPFKGDASYWSLRHGPADIAWTYAEPIEAAERIRGLIAFYNDKVEIEICS
jgi:uncharacterized protein (DUF427 family)